MELRRLVSVLYVVATTTAFVTRSWDESFKLASNVVSNMTLEEKVGILTGTGQFTSRCIGDTHPVPRLEIPSICMNDGPAGLRAIKGVTGFPSGINVASTFSRRLMRARGRAMGEESRAKGVNMLLAPAMDIMRSPKAGRAWESFGVDPFLNGEGAFETVTGIQSVGVMACAKHFLANNQEHWRYGLSSDIDDRALHELYWYPFIRSIQAGVSSVMCAYNRLNQTSSCHNEALLGPNGLLRGEGGFQGFVVSDWGGTHDTTEENANAGLDMEQPGGFIFIGGGVYGDNLKNSVTSGRLDKARLDEMATRVLASWYRLGQDQGFPPVNFDAQHPDGSGPLNKNVMVRTAEHTALVREIASASAVLLKNSRTTSNTLGLPLKAPKSIAIIGQDAKKGKLDCNLNECNEGTMVIGWGSGSNSLEYMIAPVDAFTTMVGSTATLTASLSNDKGTGAAAAAGKDVAIVFVNAMSGELGVYDLVAGNMGDRNDLELWWGGGALVETVAAANRNTVVVVHSVGPVLMPWSNHPNITAIIYAGAPGEQTGPSIVDVLYGTVNPSGRLPFSIADSEDAYPAKIVYNSAGFPTITYTEKLNIDYRYMQAMAIQPRFEFGFGLSYSTFSYSFLQITPAAVSGMSLDSIAYEVRFRVMNSGAIKGTEIAQLYLSFPASAGEPPMVLRGFEEVALIEPGETRDVVITLKERDLSIWDVESQRWEIPAGNFQVLVGASIKDIRLRGVI